MRKIPTLYVRDRSTGFVTDVVTPGCEWVMAGEGVPTRKFDGTCVMFDGTDWWARREVKPGKTPPPGWVEVDADEVTGKRAGWEPIEQSSFVKFWREALDMVEPLGTALGIGMRVGTYELCGPKINGNPERCDRHVLIWHGGEEIGMSDDEDPGNLIVDCREAGWEGVVWHHPDGRMAKLKVRDYPKSALS